MLTATAVTVLLLREFVATSYYIPSRGMEPAIHQGERILVNRWSYGLRCPLMRWWGYHRWKSESPGRGDIVVFNNPGNYREKVISDRETFIGRCAGLPGDTLYVDSLYRLHSRDEFRRVRECLYPKEWDGRLDSLLAAATLPMVQKCDSDTTHYMRRMDAYDFYQLTQKPSVAEWLKERPDSRQSLEVYPLIIPSKGHLVKVYSWNRALFCNMYNLHEHRRAEIKDGELLLEGKPVQYCSFEKEYLWVTVNNPMNVADSRMFGLLPYDHLIGKAAYIWFSKEGGNPFGGYRWNRVWKKIE